MPESTEIVAFKEKATKISFIELKDKALSSSILSEGKKTKETKAKGLKVIGENENFKKKSKVKRCFYKLMGGVK